MDTSYFSNFAANRLFAGIDPQHLQVLYQRGTVVTLSEGETLIEEGLRNTNLYLVLRGELQAVLPKQWARITEVRLGLLGPGDCVGEYSVLDCNSTSATVRAGSAAVVFKLGARELAAVMAADTDLASVFYRNLSMSLIARLREKDAACDMFQRLEDDAA